MPAKRCSLCNQLVLVCRGHTMPEVQARLQPLMVRVHETRPDFTADQLRSALEEHGVKLRD